MSKWRLIEVAAAALAFCIVSAMVCPAQTLTTLVSFDITDGASPYGPLLIGADGNFYGVTTAGGSAANCNNNEGCGTIFKVTPGGTLTTLYSFCAQANCADGLYPNGGLVQGSDGNIYGTTSEGGRATNHTFCSPGCGTVFQLTAQGVFTTLYAFCVDSNCSDGFSPSALAPGSDGNFYGTTYEGGSVGSSCNQVVGCGSVFKITPGGALTTVYSFCSLAQCADGRFPTAPLVRGSDGDFYGTTSAGGISSSSCLQNCGVLFKITPAGSLTPLYEFCSQANCADGSDPEVALVEGSDGNFYGSTEAGGTGTACGRPGCGTIFRITPSGVLTTLYDDCSQSQCADGRRASPLVQGSDGNLYATMTSGGPCVQGNCGTFFRITTSGALTTLYTFCSRSGCADGNQPQGVVQASNGDLYGTTAFEGIQGGNSFGTVFAWSFTVVAPKFTPTSLNFGNQVLNTTSAAKTITMKNPNVDPLGITSITASAGFAVSSNTCGGSLAAGKFCSIWVTFTPTQTGKLTGTLSVADSAPNSPQNLPLTGTGVEPAMLTPASFTFNPEAVGKTGGPKAFTLTNYQSVSLTSIAMSTTGDFAISATTCGTSLAAKTSCTISVTFTPTAKGTRTGQLKVSDSASNSPQTASLTGTGE